MNRPSAASDRQLRRLRAGSALTSAAALYLSVLPAWIVMVSQIGALSDEALLAAIGLPVPASPPAAAGAAFGVYLFAFLSLLPPLGLWRKSRVAAAAGLVLPLAGLLAADASYAGILVPVELLAAG